MVELDLQVDDSCFFFLTKWLKATTILFSLLKFPLLYVPLVMNSTSGRINKIFFVCVCVQEGAIAYSTDRSTPQQYPCSTPSSELDHTSQYDGAGVGHDMVPGAENALLASLLPNMAQQMQSVQLMPSG